MSDFVERIYDFNKDNGLLEQGYNYKGKRYRPGMYSTIKEAVESLIIVQQEVLENG